MRLFVAAELPECLVEELAETSALLRGTLRGRYVAPDSLHVTLAFLGEVPGSRLEEVEAAVARACEGRARAEVSLGPLGSFGRRRSATLWQSVESDGALEALAGAVRSELRNSGFSFDEKGFLAHVPLMRAVDLSSGELPMPHVASAAIDTVTLFSSDLSGGRPRYESLFSVVLD